MEGEMKVKCNMIEKCSLGCMCNHSKPHEKVLMCSVGTCVFLYDKAECAPVDTVGLRFEAPTWAHYPMKRLGMNPFSLEDWDMFKEHCE